MVGKTRRQSGRITLAEVASHAGVSLSTASFVLNGKSGRLRISQGTHERVLASAARLDYTPNLLVKSMQSGRTNVISFFNAFRVRTIGDLYMDRLSATLEVAAGDAGYDLLMHCAFHRTNEETYRFLNGGQIDAVIMFAPISDDPLLPLLRASKLPVVLVNSCDPAGQLPSVKDDVMGAMDSVAQQLVQNGHSRIAALVEPGDDVRDADERVGALRVGLQRRGITLKNPIMVSGSSDGLVRELPLFMNQENAPTALFCWRDHLAYQVLEASNLLGWRVPEKFSVVGYDGLHWPAATHHEAASVHIDLHQLAQETVRLIDTLIQAKEPEISQVEIATSFKPGTTLGPCPT